MERLTHVDESGAARMVDVSGKDVTSREAVAAGRVLVSSDVVELLRGAGVPKGDTLAVARLAGIMGAKQTPSLIPLCHPLAISSVTVGLEVADDGVEITATVRTTDRTGVENLWIADADGANPRAVSKDQKTNDRPQIMVSPAWTPDGQYIIVSKSRPPEPGTFGLFLYHRDGGTGVRIGPAPPPRGPRGRNRSPQPGDRYGRAAAAAAPSLPRSRGR